MKCHFLPTSHHLLGPAFILINGLRPDTIPTIPKITNQQLQTWCSDAVSEAKIYRESYESSGLNLPKATSDSQPDSKNNNNRRGRDTTPRNSPSPGDDIHKHTAKFRKLESKNRRYDHYSLKGHKALTCNYLIDDPPQD